MSTLKINTLSNVAGSQSISTDRVAQGTAAAWVNFNGTGTVAIRASYNVSSITDNGTGDYTINFASALADANYAAVATGVSRISSEGLVQVIGYASSDAVNPTTYTASAVRVFSKNSSGAGGSDTALVSVAIFR